MKRFWKIVAIALICGSLATPQIEARGRNSNNNSQRTESRGSQRANNQSRPGGDKGNTPQQSGGQSRPGGNNQGRPAGGSQNQGQKPGNGQNQGRPSGNNNKVQPQKPNGNNHGQKPSVNKQQSPQRGHVTRPHCPPSRPYYRPTPPASFKPHSGCPVLRSVLGITFGTTLNLSIDYLNRNGYSIYNYGSDVVYLRNVNQYGYMWPDATLYYGSNGLTGSQFMYSTNYYDMGRYNMVYNSLVNQYGAPVSTQNISNGVVATWWGYDGQYVSLEYRPIYTNNGQLRYFTTLSFGI